MSQYELAVAVRARPEAISRYETGKIQRPSADVCARIADATGCGLEWLILGTGDPGIVLGDDDSQTDAA